MSKWAVVVDGGDDEAGRGDLGDHCSRMGGLGHMERVRKLWEAVTSGRISLQQFSRHQCMPSHVVALSCSCSGWQQLESKHRRTSRWTTPQSTARRVSALARGTPVDCALRHRQDLAAGQLWQQGRPRPRRHGTLHPQDLAGPGRRKHPDGGHTHLRLCWDVPSLRGCAATPRRTQPTLRRSRSASRRSVGFPPPSLCEACLTYAPQASQARLKRGCLPPIGCANINTELCGHLQVGRCLGWPDLYL